MTTVTRDLRHTRRHRCPVCDGAEEDPRGLGKRCTGFTSADGLWTRCSREEKAGAIPADEQGLYRHLMKGQCKCGETHGAALAPRQRTSAVEETYPYVDESGALLFEVVRFSGKQFRQRQPDGAGGWKWKLDGVRRVLYHLPRLLGSDDARPVYVVEGEKDVHALEAAGEIATCNPGGAGKWPAVSDCARGALKGRIVVVIGDADAVGRKHAHAVAAALEGVAKSVSVLEAPAPHKDAADLLRAGGSLELLIPCELPAPGSPQPVESEPGNASPVPWLRVVEPGAPEDKWRESLIMRTGKDGERTIMAVAANVATILRHHPSWDGVIAYDAFAETVVTCLPPPWDALDAPAEPKLGEWTDVDTARCAAWLLRNERINVAIAVVEQALATVAEASLIHPVRDYLRALRWDGQQRLPSVLHTYFGCEDSPYTAAVGIRWMISAVARIMIPGSQADCTLILESPQQGVGKTSAFRALVGVDPSWYADTGITVGDKDSYQNLRGVWVYGLDELDSLRKGDVTRWKTYLSQTRDRYRPSYGRRTKDVPRQNVFCGTTNEEAYFSDRSGNRRFWPARVVASTIDTKAIVRDRDQLWAEAVARFDSGEAWHVDSPELRTLCEAEQEARVNTDPWETGIAKWLAFPTERADGERRLPFKIHAEGVSTDEILEHVIDRPRKDWTRADHMRVADCLRAIGLTESARVREHNHRVRRFRRPTLEIEA